MKIINLIIIFLILTSCAKNKISKDEMAIQYAFYLILKDSNFHPVIISGDNYLSYTQEYHNITFDTTGFIRAKFGKIEANRITAILPIRKISFKEFEDIENTTFNSLNHECNFIVTDFYKDNYNHYLISIIVGTKKSGFWVEYKLYYDKGLFVLQDERGGVH